MCPLCKTTKLNVGSKDPPNYSSCTECKNQVCSLCGFSPPDSAVRTLPPFSFPSCRHPNKPGILASSVSYMRKAGGGTERGDRWTQGALHKVTGVKMPGQDERTLSLPVALDYR